MAVSGMRFVGLNPTLVAELETRTERGFEGLAMNWLEQVR